MEQEIDHDALDAALRRCGSSWDAAQVHGLLSGRLAVVGAADCSTWLDQVLEGVPKTRQHSAECRALLNALCETTQRRLAARLSEFAPLLPDDSESTAVRAAGLAHWCEGFLHGLVSTHHSAALKARLAAEPLADIIKDMLQITRASAEDEGDEDSNEEAYAEIVEYLRVAAQLAYEELADVRHDNPEQGASSATGVLHQAVNNEQ